MATLSPPRLSAVWLPGPGLGLELGLGLERVALRTRGRTWPVSTLSWALSAAVFRVLRLWRAPHVLLAAALVLQSKPTPEQLPSLRVQASWAALRLLWRWAALWHQQRTPLVRPWL